MILKMQCSINPPSWHYSDHVEDLHFDILQKKGEHAVKEGEEEVQSLAEICKNKSDYIEKVIIISDNHLDYHSITVTRIDRLGQKVKEWYISDAEIYLLNDEGKTIECIRK